MRHLVPLFGAIWYHLPPLDIRPYLLMSFGASWYQLPPLDIRQYLLTSFGANWYQLPPLDIRRYLLLSFGARWYQLPPLGILLLGRCAWLPDYPACEHIASQLRIKIALSLETRGRRGESKSLDDHSAYFYCI